MIGQWPWWAIIPVIAVIISSAWLYAWLGIKSADAEDEWRECRKCEGCGNRYHPSWGEFCQNCTGAD